tara:strand:- start:1057 stop:2091 length:1035 start_codon:yes stop_codon:yes gene_type:complete
MPVINFENMEDKMKSIIGTCEWENLSVVFKSKKNIIIFGHGGNMGVCDHGAIDIGRLTDKCVFSPGSAIVCTSLISDFSFETWINEWLNIVFRGIDLQNTLVIGCSCSVGTQSSNTITNALDFAQKKGCETCLISARTKNLLLPDTIKIITDSIYYHTHEVISLMLIYQLIYSYNNYSIPNEDLIDCPPPIKVKYEQTKEKGCEICDYGALDHSFCPPPPHRDVPPGLEKDENNLAIDFDGVLHNFDKGYYDGTCYGEPIDGALLAIQSLSLKYNIIIYSSKCLPDRPKVNGLTGRELIIGWLQKYDILKYVKDITHLKPRAKYYIDDKAIEFKGNWKDILKRL